jgi:hypothetical protein
MPNQDTSYECCTFFLKPWWENSLCELGETFGKFDLTLPNGVVLFYYSTSRSLCSYLLHYLFPCIENTYLLPYYSVAHETGCMQYLFFCLSQIPQQFVCEVGKAFQKSAPRGHISLQDPRRRCPQTREAVTLEKGTSTATGVMTRMLHPSQLLRTPMVQHVYIRKGRCCPRPYPFLLFFLSCHGSIYSIMYIILLYNITSIMHSIIVLLYLIFYRISR